MRSMSSDVDHGIGLKSVFKPEIKSDILVMRRHKHVVISLLSSCSHPRDGWGVNRTFPYSAAGKTRNFFSGVFSQIMILLCSTGPQVLSTASRNFFGKAANHFL